MDNDPITKDVEKMKENVEVSPLISHKIPTMDDFTHLSWYSLRILLFSEFIILAAMGNMTYMMYSGAAPKRISCLGGNYTIDNVCQPGYDYRSMKECEWDIEYEFKSVNLEFNYLCADTKWVKSSISVQMFGVLVGALFFGHLSDKYGRRKILLSCFSLCALSSIAVSFSTSLNMFTALRTVVGFFNGGQTTIYAVYKVEHIPRKHRLWTASLISFAPNFIVMNIIAYLSGDWRTFQRAIVVVSAPALLLALFTYESPRWLISRGRIEEAEVILKNISRIDGKKDVEGLHKLIESEYEKEAARVGKIKNYNVRHLFYTRDMGMATLCFCMGVFFTSMISYGLMFNMETLSGSLFMNSALFGILRWALNSVMGVVDYKFTKCGRKLFHGLAQGMTAICVGAVGMTYICDKVEEWSHVIRIGTICAKAVISQVYVSKSISAVEYYPTVVRNTAISFKSTWSRVGTILAPQLFLYSPWQSLPYVVLFIMSLTDTVAFQLILPETKTRTMPDSLPEKNKKRKDLVERTVS